MITDQNQKKRSIEGHYQVNILNLHFIVLKSGGEGKMLPATLEEGRRALIINTIVLSSPDVATGTILLSR